MLALLLLTALHAATYTVGAGGDFASLDEALSSAAEGDELLLLPGTYEGFKLQKDLLVRARDGLGSAIIDGSSTTTYAVVDLSAGEVQDLLVVNAPQVGIRLKGESAARRVEVRGPGTIGVLCWGDSPAVEEALVTGSEQHGFKVSDGSPELHRCIAEDSASAGYYLLTAGDYQDLLALGGKYGFELKGELELDNCEALDASESAVKLHADADLVNFFSGWCATFLDCNDQHATVTTSLAWHYDSTSDCPGSGGFDLAVAYPSLRLYSPGDELGSIDPRPTAGSPLVDAGTGSDPDGSTADIGVFGGPESGWTDADGDGLPIFFDCDESNAHIYPGAEELADGLDNDCDGVVDEGTDTSAEARQDLDGDGYTADQDCDDHNLATYPGAMERLDGADNDCDGQVDEGLWTTDDDGDGYSEQDGDCDDTDAERHPGAPDDDADGVDDDCDGADDAGGSEDADGDGYSVDDGDCDDTDPDVNPGAWDSRNGVDSDCDGWTDGDQLGRDLDGDGVTPWDGDCDDGDIATAPGFPEAPDDFVDQDCDGTDLYDVDGDGDPAPASGGTDCDDTDPSIHPGAAEACNGLDDDCDGRVDEFCQEDGEDRAMALDQRLVTANCNCSSAGGAPGAWPALLVLLLAPARRRHSSRP